MPDRGLIILALITLVAVSGCWFTVAQRNQAGDTGNPETTRVFPSLHENLKRISEIEVARSGSRFALSRNGGDWFNHGVGGYPALTQRIEDTIAAVASLQYIAAKTGRAGLYPRLGVEEVSSTAKSTRLTFRDDQGAVLADILAGRNKGGFDNPGVYIRLPGQAPAWLASGSLDVHYDAIGWSDNEVVDFDRESLRTLTINGYGEEIALYRPQAHAPELTLKYLPAGYRIAHQYQINYMATLLEQMRFVDARKAVEPDSDFVPIVEAAAELQDHPGITLRVVETLPDGSAWVEIFSRTAARALESDATTAAAAAERIHSKFDGWQVRIPGKHMDRLRVRLADIIEKS